jgi:hypothetical protein
MSRSAVEMMNGLKDNKDMKSTSVLLLFAALLTLSCSKKAPGLEKAASTPSQTNPHSHTERPERTPKPVPAFQSVEGTKDLPKTLDPSIFAGSVRSAYQVVKEIPETIAQLPCYCRCDTGMGHKSLHTCFVDDHAANCGICTNSALKAYKLQKEKKMTPEQIRDELIAEYKNL